MLTISGLSSENYPVKFKSVAQKAGVKPSNIAEIFGDGKKEIEDLFSEKDARELDVRSKSFDKAACLSHKLPRIYDCLEDETKENFAKVIDYIMAQ